MRKNKAIIHTVETLKAMTIECGDCWEWQKYYGNKVPYVCHDGKMQSVRKVFSSLIGHQYPPNGFIIPKCENVKCVNPDHYKHQTPSQMSRRIAKKTVQTVQKRMKIQKHKHESFSKLDWQKVDEIRASDMSARKIAPLYNVHPSLICRVRKGLAWVRYDNNPFQGLMR
jgi:hypothetical protein